KRDWSSDVCSSDLNPQQNNHTQQSEKHSSDSQQEHHDHHAHILEDFKKRFWISIIVTIPILLLSHMLQDLVGLGQTLRFSGDLYCFFVRCTCGLAYVW